MEKIKENLKKSAQKGIPSSLFLLGRNYLKGTSGFDKNLDQAERYLRQASKVGHVEAHVALGKLLLELKKNEEAFEYIKLAAEKGSDEGQHELGILFAYGQGCARDEAKARWWLRHVYNVDQQLISHPSHSSHPELEETHKAAWIERQIGYGRKTSKFETRHQLTHKLPSMSIQERNTSYLAIKITAENAAKSAARKFLGSISKGLPRTPYFRSNCITPEGINELMSRAENGSTTAQSFFKACKMVENAMDLLERQETNDAFKLVRLSLREWDLPILEYSDFYSNCFSAAKKVLERNFQNADAFYILVRFDSTQSKEEKLRMAKYCVELDPSVPDYHHLLACTLGFVGDHINGLSAIDRAIEMLPNQTEWLYDRAGFLRQRDAEHVMVKNIYSVEAADAYLKFISSNPADHRLFPYACYFYAHIYALSDDKTIAKTYYQKGLDSEDPRVRLPCFEPIKEDTEFPAKVMTKMLLTFWNGSEETAGPSAVAASEGETTNNCANCFKSNQSLRCTACKNVWYCDRACQLAHWKKHKVECKCVNRS